MKASRQYNKKSVTQKNQPATRLIKQNEQSTQNNFPHTLIINYGQILYKIIPGPFKHVYHQDKVLNHANSLNFDVFCMGSFVL